MYKKYIEKHPTLVSIILFLVLFSVIQLGHPAFLYNTDGSIRQFGIGYRNKTIFPIWILAITLAILCYLFVLFYTN
jgi:membrane-associated protease RseP (regulator of RpoE activity)